MEEKINFELYIIEVTYLFINQSRGSREAQKSDLQCHVSLEH